MNDSVFTKIINRELPAHILHEDETVISFLTLGPLKPGHLLVVPKVQIDHIWDLDDNTYGHVMMIANKMAQHLRSFSSEPRVGLFVMGFGVPHAHVHVSPIDESIVAPLEKDVKSVNPEELDDIAKKLRLIIK